MIWILVLIASMVVVAVGPVVLAMGSIFAPMPPEKEASLLGVGEGGLAGMDDTKLILLTLWRIRAGDGFQDDEMLQTELKRRATE